MVAWELYGPQAEDHQFLGPRDREHAVNRTASGAEVTVRFKVIKPGSYRLRAATVDTAGRTTVVWKSFVVRGEGPGKALRWQDR